MVYGRLFDEDLPNPCCCLPGPFRIGSRPGIGSQSIHLEERTAVWPAIDKPTLFMTGSMRRDRNCWHVVDSFTSESQPSGAVAKLIKDGNFEVTPASMPDPDGRVQRAAPGLMEWRHVTVSHTQYERRSIVFTCNGSRLPAQWNGTMKPWPRPLAGSCPDGKRRLHPVPGHPWPRSRGAS